jgi:hypothetical protein
MKWTTEQGLPAPDTMYHDQLTRAVIWDVVEPRRITSLLEVEDGDVLYIYDLNEGEHYGMSSGLCRVYVAGGGVAHTDWDDFLTEEVFLNRLSKGKGCTRVARLKSTGRADRVRSWAQLLVGS